MLLSPDDAQLFFRLHRALMFFVNNRLHVLPDKISSPEEFSGQPPEARLKVRKAFLDDIDLIEVFVDKNPTGLSDDELEIVLSWHHLVSGSFFIFRGLKKYTVFLSSDEEPIAYGVTALTQPFDELVGPYLPIMTETVLLPFKDKIVYDGLLAGPGVSLSFGAGIRRSLNEQYQTAKERYGIVTSLPVAEQPMPKSEPARSVKKRPARNTEVENPFVGTWWIVSMPDFDEQYLHEEVRAFIQFDGRNTGEFQFGYVHGNMDCRLTSRDGEPTIEWTWDGNDEMDPAQGRGLAVLKEAELHGTIFFHQGDQHDFVAKQKGGKKTKR